MCSGALLWKLLAFALGQPASEGFDRSSDVVHELGAAIYQRLAGPDDGHMGLRVFAPMLEGVQQLRVHSCQASQVLGVYLIGLAFVGVDEPQLPGIGHQNLVATLL
jgi:hypothetical protein